MIMVSVESASELIKAAMSSGGHWGQFPWKHAFLGILEKFEKVIFD